MKKRWLACAIPLLLSYPAFAGNLYESNGNILLGNDNGENSQLTSNGGNSLPTLSPDGKLVAFVHLASGAPISTGSGASAPTELWVVTVSTKKAEKIVSPRNAKDMRNVIAGISALQFSTDSKTLFFLSDAWTVSGAVHKVNLATKKESFLTAGKSLKVIRSGKYKGDLMVDQHRYHRQGGAYDCDYVIGPDGKEVSVEKSSCDE